MRRHLSLGLHLFEHAIQKFYEIQKTRGQDDHVPIAANPAAFQEEQSAQRTIAFEKCQHHVDDNFSLSVGEGILSAASRMAGLICSQANSKTASSNPNLLLKCLMSWDWLVPAKRQIAAVVVSSKPRSANRSFAASRRRMMTPSQYGSLLWHYLSPCDCDY